MAGGCTGLCEVSKHAALSKVRQALQAYCRGLNYPCDFEL